MQTDILERIRLLESDIERRRDAIVEQQQLPIANPRHLLMRDTYVAAETAHLSRTASDLLDLYLDGDDLPAIQSEQVPLEAMMSFFSARVATIREYYRTHPEANGDVLLDVIEPNVGELLENGVFSSDEKFGTRLRLADHYAAYESFRERCANAKDDEAKKMVTRLRIPFERFIFTLTAPLAETPQKLKMLEPQRYLTFVANLRKYLVEYFSKVRPLSADQTAFKAQLKHADGVFEEYWRQVEAAATAAGETPSSEHFSSAAASSSRFQTAAVPRAHPFLVASWDLRSIPSEQQELRATAKAIALAEAEIAVLVMGPSGIMSSIVRSCAEGYQADHSKMPHELRREEEEAEEAFLTSLEDMEKRLLLVKTRAVPTNNGESFDLDLLNLGAGAAASDNANTKSNHVISGDTTTAAIGDQISLAADPNAVHVDADGNPLPTWQIRLEGRRQKFTCEVCAGDVYCGTKLWNAHFRGAKHTEGLRRLGILNTPSFFGVDTIAGATLIHNQLKNAGHSTNLLKRIRDEWAWMEVEDEAGMVMQRADYDRARQQMGRAGAMRSY